MSQPTTQMLVNTCPRNMETFVFKLSFKMKGFSCTAPRSSYNQETVTKYLTAEEATNLRNTMQRLEEYTQHICHINATVETFEDLKDFRAKLYGQLYALLGNESTYTHYAEMSQGALLLSGANILVDKPYADYTVIVQVDFLIV